MKCPYNNFKNCIGTDCPSCLYEEEEYEKTCGRMPNVYKYKAKRYIFKGCKLIEDSVQPIPSDQNTYIDNSKKATAIGIKKGLF